MSRRIIPNPAYRDAPYEEHIQLLMGPTAKDYLVPKDIELPLGVKGNEDGTLSVDMGTPRRYATVEDTRDPEHPGIPPYIIVEDDQ